MPKDGGVFSDVRADVGSSVGVGVQALPAEEVVLVVGHRRPPGARQAPVGAETGEDPGSWGSAIVIVNGRTGGSRRDL